MKRENWCPSTGSGHMMRVKGRFVTAVSAMRVLFSTTAGTGHFGPIPVARVCDAAGHTVAVAAPGSYAEAVTGARFDHLPFPEPSPELIGEVFGRAPAATFEEIDRLVLAQVFGRLDAQSCVAGSEDDHDRLATRCGCPRALRVGSMVAAERAGISQLQVAIMTGRIGAGSSRWSEVAWQN